MVALSEISIGKTIQRYSERHLWLALLFYCRLTLYLLWLRYLEVGYGGASRRPFTI